MPKWVVYMLALVIPAFAFLVLKDTAGGFYLGSKSSQLSYVVVEPEELAAVEPEAAPAEPEIPVTEEVVVADQPSDDTVADVDVATAQDETVLEAEPEAEVQLAGVLSDDEVDAAARVARACASCHQFERERNGAGPHLVGIGGRAVGSVDGFRYSDALISLNTAGEVWSADALEQWLAGPSDYAPGTKMNFVVSDAEDRRLIAEWLVQKDQ